MRKTSLFIFVSFILLSFIILINLNVALAEEICDNSNVGKTYCQDEKIVIVCSPSMSGDETTYSWVPIACDKCENGQCTQEKTCPTTQTTCKDGTVVGCKTINNECICSSCPAQLPCSESDRGRNYNEMGDAKAIAGEILSTEDVCNSDGFLYEYYCIDDKIYLDKHLCPYGCSNGACTKEQPQTATCKDTDETYIVSVSNGILHPPNKDRYVKGSINYNGVTYEDSCASMVYFSDSIGNNNLIRYERSPEGKGVFEVGCLDGKTPHETTYYECPNGCKNGACITEEICKDCTKEKVKEQIICTFINSDKEQQCYIAGGFTTEDEGTRFCKGKETCVINYESFRGERVTWKSTCGQYQHTIHDGKDEQIKFECKTGETTLTEIKDKNYRFVSFQCYDGEESKSADREACKTTEFWKKFAENFCENHCKDSRELKCKTGEKCVSKCGVNTFSVLGECYNEEEVLATPIPTTPISTQTREGIPVEKEVPIATQIGSILVCKDSCPLEGKCYPFGYRKSEQYCSDIGKFVEQFKGNNKCDNNFECESNVCINNECMSQGFINKIISWFKKLFGSS